MISILEIKKSIYFDKIFYNHVLRGYFFSILGVFLLSQKKVLYLYVNIIHKAYGNEYYKRNRARSLLQKSS